MTLHIDTPFAYYVGHGIIDDFDFTDIRNEKRTVASERQMRNPSKQKWLEDVETLGVEKFHDKYYRILESHTNLRDNITNKFRLFLENTYGSLAAKITASWITCLEEGDEITNHMHSNCFYSGLLYFDEEYGVESAPLEIKNPLTNMSETIVPSWHRKKSCKSIDSITITPRTGAYYFFPSICNHYTPSPHVGKPRKSLAFNFVIDSPLWLFDSSYNPKW